MKKRLLPGLNPSAFSIASQFTGPPFSVTLESAELRRHLMEEMTPAAVRKTSRRPKAKTPAKRRPKAKKKAR